MLLARQQPKYSLTLLLPKKKSLNYKLPELKLRKSTFFLAVGANLLNIILIIYYIINGYNEELTRSGD